MTSSAFHCLEMATVVLLCAYKANAVTIGSAPPLNFKYSIQDALENPHNVLGVSQDADLGAINDAYLKLCDQYNPDDQLTDSAKDKASEVIETLDVAKETLDRIAERRMLKTTDTKNLQVCYLCNEEIPETVDPKMCIELANTVNSIRKENTESVKAGVFKTKTIAQEKKNPTPVPKFTTKRGCYTGLQRASPCTDKKLHMIECECDEPVCSCQAHEGCAVKALFDGRLNETVDLCPHQAPMECTHCGVFMGSRLAVTKHMKLD